MSTDAALELAAACLLWLLGDEEALGAFLAASGAAPADLRASARDPAFLGFVLDHILADDASVLRAAEAAGIPPADVARARERLPGGAQVHWT